MSTITTEQAATYTSGSVVFRRTLTQSIIYPIILLILLVVVFLWQLSIILRTTGRVEHSNVVITQASNVLNLLVDMETGLRGYLMTDEPLFLEPYQQAQNTIDVSMSRLQNLIDDDAAQMQRLDNVYIVIKNWRQYATDSLAAQTNGKITDSTATQIAGKQIMDDIRQQFSVFVDTEDRLRNERILSTQATSQVVIIIVIISGLGVGGVLAIISRQRLIALSRNYEDALTKSYQQTEEIFNQKEWLRGVLVSIGDAVIAADVHGKIAFINQVTEQLTGWSSEMASSKALDDVYKIAADRDTPRALMAPPEALTVPSEAKWLIARDGKEIAVEDNITSIKDVYGKQIGTVLVFRDVTRRKLIEQEQRNLLETQTHYATLLRRSNEQLHQFAYIASHDLQEPLRMIISYLQLLEQRFAKSLDSDARDFIGYAVDGAARMKELITALLAYARLDSDEQEPLKLTSIEIALEKALGNLSSPIADSGAVITHDALPQLPADALQMTQLFQNLISNAIKFRSEAAPRIYVGVEKLNGECHFSVKDNGIGIAAEYQERIFGMFQRLHHRSEYAGTGIGLAICKKVIERHHGRIWVESVEGNGTTFHFCLPTQPDAPASEPISR